MRDTVDTLRAQIIRDFSGHWLLNDEAHRQSHFEAVEQCGALIARRLEMDYNEKEFMLAAYFHDLFAWSRVNHHVLSFEYVKATDYPIIAELDDHARRRIADACLQHRASTRIDFSSDLSELLCSADRGVPASADVYLKRSMKFNAARLGITEEEAIPSAIAHLHEKFGRNGYARYPKMYMIAFKEELEQFWDQIDAL